MSGRCIPPVEGALPWFPPLAALAGFAGIRACPELPATDLPWAGPTAVTGLLAPLACGMLPMRI